MTLPEENKQALIEYRLAQAVELIDEVAFLIDNKKLIFAVNRIYYGSFYALTALALREGFKTSKHGQLMGWFNKNYVATGKFDKKYGKFLFKAFRKRQIGDYEAFSDFTKEEVVALSVTMKEFIEQVKTVLSEQGQ